MFFKFLPGQRDSQLLIDSDNFTYSRKKDKDTPLNTAWRCSKNRSLKCHAKVYLDTNNALSQGYFFSPMPKCSEKHFLKFKKQYKADRKFARASRLVVFLAFVPIDFIAIPII